jgi:esterase
MKNPMSAMLEDSPRLHYLEWNSDAADALILVHGNSANAHWWRWVVEALDRPNLRIIALDLRGHGDSEWIRPPAYSPHAYSDDITRLIETFALSHPIVAGHSMGGIAALAFARQKPHLARAIIAIDIAVTSTERRNRYLRHLKALPTVVYPDLAMAKTKFRLMPNEGTIASDVLSAIAEHSLARTPEGGYTMKFDRESFFGSDGLDVASAIREVTLPMLLIRAGESRILTAEAAVTAEKMNPLVKLVTIPDAHHHLPLESPEKLAREIANFIEEHPRTSG